MKRTIIVTTALVALSLLCIARAASVTARSHRTGEALRHEVERWEDEGGSVAPARAG